jgi:hypothetical protein
MSAVLCAVLWRPSSGDFLWCTSFCESAPAARLVEEDIWDGAPEFKKHLINWDALSKAGIFDETGKFSQYVFEVRVQLGAYDIHGNNLHKSLWENWFIEFDTNCNSRNLEWLSDKSEDLEVTGVVVRELPCALETMEHESSMGIRCLSRTIKPQAEQDLRLSGCEAMFGFPARC